MTTSVQFLHGILEVANFTVEKNLLENHWWAVNWLNFQLTFDCCVRVKKLTLLVVNALSFLKS
jgi:hypothetical protein